MDPRVRVVRAPERRHLRGAQPRAGGRVRPVADLPGQRRLDPPRRIEHQVQNLLDNPGVLANRTWALRAYPDLTLTFVGYSCMRLNAASSSSTERRSERCSPASTASASRETWSLPLRLKAVRPGSVRDMERPGPLAITRLRLGSLSRDDALPGWTRWDRLAYRDNTSSGTARSRLGAPAPISPRRRGAPSRCPARPGCPIAPPSRVSTGTSWSWATSAPVPPAAYGPWGSPGRAPKQALRPPSPTPRPRHRCRRSGRSSCPTSPPTSGPACST